MIRSFKCKLTEKLYNDEFVKKFSSILIPAQDKLLLLASAHVLEDLRVPPGNRLEALKGDRKGYYSIRINDQWRICFRWIDGDAAEVEIVDYH